MSKCDFTNATSYSFNNELCDQCEVVNYINPCTDRNLNQFNNCTTTESNQWVQTFISKILDIPAQKPDLESITSVNTNVKIISQKVVKTPVPSSYYDTNGQLVDGDEIDNAEGTRLTGRKLIIEGTIQQKVIYTSLTPSQAMHSATFTIPFSEIIIVDKDTPLSQKYQITPIVEDVFVCALSERNLFFNNTVYIQATRVC